jgi:hypothetical protein
MGDKQETIEERLERIEIFLGIRPGNSALQKPVNEAAYERAIVAFAEGNRKPMDEYVKYYRIPT